MKQALVGAGRWLLLVVVLGACIATPPGQSLTTASPTPPGSTGAPSTSVAPATPSPSASVIPATPTPTPTASAVVLVGCGIAQAFGGDAGVAAVPLANCRDPADVSTPIAAGGQIFTDANGEAWVDTAEGTRLYVFQRSTLRISGCRKGTAESGRLCLQDGTAGWRDRGSGTVALVTPTGSITPTGTWLSITYDPERELTLALVFEGSAVATPFVERNGEQEGERVQIRAGSFWFTSPNDRLEDIGGLEPRKAHDFEKLPAVIQTLGLQSTLATIVARASADEVRTDTVPRLLSINIRGGGGPLADPRVQDALLLTTDWETEVSRAFPNGEGTIVTLIGTAGVRNLRNELAEPEQALLLLRQAEATPFSVTIVVGPVTKTASAETFGRLGKVLLTNFSQLDFGIEPVVYTAKDAHDAAQAFDERIAKDVPVMWLSTR